MSVDMKNLNMPSLEAIEVALDRKACETSLSEFVKRAWPTLEPSTKLTWGKILDVVCSELEQIYFNPGFQPRLLVNIPPGPGWIENLVMTNKGRKRLGDIKPGDMVLTHKGRYRKVTHCYSKGDLPVLKITTNSGRRIWATHDHHCLTGRGWQRAEDMRVGDVMAFVSPEEQITERFVSPEEARLLGYLIGDGSVTQASTLFTNIDQDILEDFVFCANKVGFQTSRKKRKSHEIVAVLGGESVREWRRKFGIDRKSSYTKRIPEQILNSDNEILRNFIGAYWSCDGIALACQ